MNTMPSALSAVVVLYPPKYDPCICFLTTSSATCGLLLTKHTMDHAQPRACFESLTLLSRGEQSSPRTYRQKKMGAANEEHCYQVQDKWGTFLPRTHLVLGSSIHLLLRSCVRVPKPHPGHLHGISMDTLSEPW